MNQNESSLEIPPSSVETRIRVLTLYDIFVVWFVFYIVGLLLTPLIFFCSPVEFLGRYLFIPIFPILSGLESLLSLYLTLKFFLPNYLIYSENKIENKIKWDYRIKVALWLIPFINIVPLFFIWLGAALSAGAHSFGNGTLFLGASLPYIGLILVLLQIKKTNSFSIHSIEMIPVFLCIFEIKLVYHFTL